MKDVISAAISNMTGHLMQYGFEVYDAGRLTPNFRYTDPLKMNATIQSKAVARIERDDEVHYRARMTVNAHGVFTVRAERWGGPEAPGYTPTDYVWTFAPCAVHSLGVVRTIVNFLSEH